MGPAAAHVAERIRGAVEREHFTPEPGGPEVGVTVSIGYAVFPEHARTPEALVEAADQALYRSKEGGRNRVSSADVPAAETPAVESPPKSRKRKART